MNMMPTPRPGGLEPFDTPGAVAINRARLAHLASLGLPLSGTRILQVGSGVVHHAQVYLERDCTVVCIDRQRENIRRCAGTILVSSLTWRTSIPAISRR